MREKERIHKRKDIDIFKPHHPSPLSQYIQQHLPSLLFSSFPPKRKNQKSPETKIINSRIQRRPPILVQAATQTRRPSLQHGRHRPLLVLLDPRADLAAHDPIAIRHVRTPARNLLDPDGKRPLRKRGLGLDLGSGLGADFGGIGAGAFGVEVGLQGGLVEEAGCGGAVVGERVGGHDLLVERELEAVVLAFEGAVLEG